MRIRHATVEDADPIRSMLAEYYKGERELGGHYQVGEPLLAQAMSLAGSILSRAVPGAVLMAEEGEEPIGLGAFWCEEKQGHDFSRVAVPWLTYVRPEHRRKGVGSELLAYREKTARALGCVAIRSTVLLGNAAGMELLKRAGYNPAEVVFEKRLP